LLGVVCAEFVTDFGVRAGQTTKPSGACHGWHRLSHEGHFFLVSSTGETVEKILDLGRSTLGSIRSFFSRVEQVNIYVGNLAYSVTEDQLRDAFAQYGEVAKVSIIMDRMTGRSKGFGFVEMNDSGEAEAAIKALNEQPLNGRSVRVNEARPREERPRRPY
jgi:hypothetical protein